VNSFERDKSFVFFEQMLARHLSGEGEFFHTFLRVAEALNSRQTRTGENCVTGRNGWWLILQLFTNTVHASSHQSDVCFSFMYSRFLQSFSTNWTNSFWTNNNHGLFKVTWRHLKSRGVTYRHMASLTVTWRHLPLQCFAYRHIVSLTITWLRLSSHASNIFT
jgi:hypothetical protein